MRALILRPLISEKSVSLKNQDLYTFEVAKEATKEQIKNLLAKKFNVDVIEVKTINIKGKRKLQRSRRGYFTTPPIKKAVIKIKSGQKIPLFEEVKKEESLDKTKDKKVEVKTAEGERLTTVKEKKSLLKGTKVKIEKDTSKKEKEGDK